MIDISKLKDQLARHEGVRHKVYKDTVGKLTIGIGRNLTDVGLSHAEIDLLFDNDIERTIAGVRQVPAFIWLEGDDVRQRVLINMAFNLGLGGLLGFKETLLAIERGDYGAAADRMLLSKWADQVGSRAHELATMMRSGLDVHGA